MRDSRMPTLNCERCLPHMYIQTAVNQWPEQNTGEKLKTKIIITGLCEGIYTKL